MRNKALMGVAAMGLLAAGGAALGLSIALPEPKIAFPRGYDQARAKAIGAVLADRRLGYIDGLYSHWPPAWSSTLVYGGNTQALNTMLAGLRRVGGVKVRVTFARDLAREAGTGHSVGNWQVTYAHDRQDVVGVRINLASKAIDLAKMELWLAPAEPTPDAPPAPETTPPGPKPAATR